MKENVNLKIKKIINDFYDTKRFFIIETEQKFWFYDSFSQRLYSITKELFNYFNKQNYTLEDFINEKSFEDSSKVLNFFMSASKVQEDIIPEYHKDSKCTVMINTSNRCNLNCSYCYRDKNNSNTISIDTVSKIFDFLKNDYKPEADEYIISYSMTSESSIDLSILKEIAEKYKDFENYQFNEQDIDDFIFNDFYERIKKDLFDKVCDRIALPKKNKKDVIVFLNKLLDNEDAFDLLQLTESMFDYNKLTEIQKRKILAKWRLYRINRWCLELYYDKYINKRKIPYVCFWFMTNGTCSSDAFIQFIKSCDINPLWVSIDGPQNVQDANRMFVNNEPSYNVILKNIERMKQNGLVLRASVVLNTYYPYPLRIINHLKKLGFDSFSITPVRPGSECSFTTDNIDELFKGYDEVFDELEKQLLQHNYSLLNMLQEDMMLAPYYFFINRNKEIKRCNFDNQLVINANGEIYPCLYFSTNKDFCYGTIYGNFASQKTDIDMQVNHRGKCAECWARYLCGGTCLYGSYVTTGDFLAIEPIECRIKKYLAEKCLKLLIFMREHNINIK